MLPNSKKELLLASTSKYRQAQLAQLGLPFHTQKPLIDEEKEKDPRLTPLNLAVHLAYLKAKSLAQDNRVVIGADQLVSFNGKVLGKPGSREKAIHQLLEMQGQRHELVTSVCVFDGNQPHPFTDITILHMKKLTREQIERYLDLDEPFDCAGAYKIEKHGISLFHQIESQDFSAIQGLPLLELARVLQTCGYRIP